MHDMDDNVSRSHRKGLTETALQEPHTLRFALTVYSIEASQHASEAVPACCDGTGLSRAQEQVRGCGVLVIPEGINSPVQYQWEIQLKKTNLPNVHCILSFKLNSVNFHVWPTQAADAVLLHKAATNTCQHRAVAI